MAEDTRARDPRRESIYRSVREDPTVPVTDAGRFVVEYWPHLYAAPVGAIVAGRSCAWCPFPRVHRVHPEEV